MAKTAQSAHISNVKSFFFMLKPSLSFDFTLPQVYTNFPVLEISNSALFALNVGKQRVL
jgi:hypothetical protein